MLCAILLAAATAGAPASDPKAAAVADQVMEALGGEKAWNNTHFLRFDFAVDVDGKTVSSRSHWWDKWTGRYRVEGKTKEGDPYVVLMNLNTKDGSAWLKGKPLAGDEKKKYLEKGYAVWVNDSYWLLMPYKMKDAGVHLRLDGEVKEKNQAWDKLLLTFENVGLTPKDRYWAFVNRSTHMVDRWEFILQGEKGPAARFDWTGWKKMGAVMLAPERMNAKDKERIYFPVLDVPAAIPDAVFTSPGSGAN
jgi:hypothetical protein